MDSSEGMEPSRPARNAGRDRFSVRPHPAGERLVGLAKADYLALVEGGYRTLALRLKADALPPTRSVNPAT